MRRSFSSIFAEQRRTNSGLCLLLAFLLSLLSLVSAQVARAEFIEITPATGINVSIPLKSVKELKYRGVIRQQYDFSCGSAAVATLLTYHYAAPATEKDVFMAMFERGNRAAIQREGFSLLDMKTYLEDHG